MKLKNIQNKYLFILTLMFFCQALLVLTNWFIYYPYGKEIPINAWKVFFYSLLVMPPSIILMNIYLLSIIFKNKVYRIIINIIATIIAIIIYCFATLIQLGFMPAYRAPDYTPYTRDTYKIEVHKTYNYANMKITDFPDEIPKNAKNFCCFSYLHFNFLRFNIDKKYLVDTISKNKDKIDKIMSMSEFETNYPDTYSIFKPYISIKDADKYKVHLFKQSLYENYNYYSGIITLMETGEIIFFNLDEEAYYLDDLDKDIHAIVF